MFSEISLRGLFIFSLRTFIIFIWVVLRSSLVLQLLDYSGPATVEELGSNEDYRPGCYCVLHWQLDIWVWGGYRVRC